MFLTGVPALLTASAWLACESHVSGFGGASDCLSPNAEPIQRIHRQAHFDNPLRPTDCHAQRFDRFHPHSRALLSLRICPLSRESRRRAATLEIPAVQT